MELYLFFVGLLEEFAPPSQRSQFHREVMTRIEKLSKS
jgi:hypothetical protein